MVTDIREYRINKKGKECFRTTDRKELVTKLAALSANRPGVYTTQERRCRVDKYGVMIKDASGVPLWTTWA